MTSKLGTLWKTSWKRNNPALGTNPQDMWWFANFGDYDAGPGDETYWEQALSSPSIGEGAPPFWIGAIFGTSVPALDLSTRISRGVGVPLPTLEDWETALEWTPNNSLLSARTRVSTTLAPSFRIDADQQVSPLGASASPALIRAVVQMLVVEKIGSADIKISLWVDGFLRQQTFQEASSYAPEALGLLFIQPRFGFLNSMAGGNALPTTAEIQTWFAASRYSSPFPAAAEIPGKTLDRYDAANTPGVVPNPLVNLSTGQDAALNSQGTPPVPVNVLVATTFAY